jgi:hypothetical protein
MEKKKRKIKVWGKINLLEASCVGIPAYPEAHLASECSLVKALGLTYELNKGETAMAEEEVKTEESEAEATEEEKPEEAEKSEAPEEKEEEKSETESEEEEPSEKSFDAKSLTALVTKAVKEALKETAPERGLVSNEDVEKSMREELKKKSTGELAMEMGLFKLPQEARL